MWKHVPYSRTVYMFFQKFYHFSSVLSIPKQSNKKAEQQFIKSLQSSNSGENKLDFGKSPT